MKSNLALTTGLAATCLGLAGCGGGYTTTSYPTTPLAPPTTQLDTASVLSIIQTTTSETREPFQVDDGAVAITPAEDETGTPIPVSGA